MREVISAKPMEGYKLLVTFDNSEIKSYDMSKKLDGVFELLKNPHNFRAVKIIYGAPTWYLPNGLEVDLCPDYLYSNSVSSD